jgi:response regulator of citrate/malate metabolism
MFKILIADDNFEDRELLTLEIQQALSSENEKLTFYEASSISKAKELLRDNAIDLLTLDIQFDRLSEGIDSLPELFEKHPTLSIIVISGKLDKNEVAEQLFRFTKDNVLKGKRWARHFDVLDKKDDKKEALQRAYSFAFKQKEAADNVRDLFLLAESYLEKEDLNKCIEVYQKIQSIAPGELESSENLKILKGPVTREQIVQHMSTGDRIVGSLLFGHFLEKRLKTFARKVLGRGCISLSQCLKEIEKIRKISADTVGLFYKLMSLRNKAIHHPSAISEEEVQRAFERMELLETKRK